MKQKIKTIALIMILMMLASTVLSCSEPKKAGVISSINEDGTLTVMDTDGNSYILEPYVPETTEKPETISWVINLRECGAMGDGETDDTAAFKSALQKLSGGGTLYIPTGNYKISESIKIENNNLVIRGEGTSSKLLFSRAQTESDTPATASFLSFKDEISSIILRDFACEYTGDFMEAQADSGKGKVYGVYFGLCDNVSITGLSVTKFNASGIYIGSQTETYSTRIGVSNSALYENRVSGIEIGYVDGIGVTNCDLYKNGSSKDGNLGAGVYISEKFIPRNVRIFQNRLVSNFVAGAYLMSGEDMIINNNVASKNIVYGIYAYGKTTNDVIVSNNIITDMLSSELGGQYSGQTMSAIYCGTELEKATVRQSYTVMGNDIQQFNLKTGSSCGIYLNVNDNTNLVITDNVFEGNQIEYAMMIKSVTSESSNTTDINIANNFFKILNVKENAIVIELARKLTITQNRFIIDSCKSEACVDISSDSATQLIYIYNSVFNTDEASEHLIFKNAGESTVKIITGNIFNVKAVE